jgi:DMSO/TMAO reductase YedYZ molybdopterin-dependent catalytic subunit
VSAAKIDDFVLGLPAGTSRRWLVRGFGTAALTVAVRGRLAPARIALAQATPTIGAASTPVAEATVDIMGLIREPGAVTVDELRQYPAETVEVMYEVDGAQESHAFTGVRLFDVLNGAGFTIDADDPGALLELYVVITANDGYQVVLAVGEIAPDFGNAPILLAWEEDGTPLAPRKGPVQLVVPGDRTDGRYIFGIVTIEVRSGVASPD